MSKNKIAEIETILVANKIEYKKVESIIIKDYSKQEGSEKVEEFIKEKNDYMQFASLKIKNDEVLETFVILSP